MRLPAFVVLTAFGASLAFPPPVRAQANPPAAAAVPAVQQPRPDTLPAADLRAAIDQLSSIDYPVRMDAARRLRRAPAAQVVPALLAAAESHKDGYVRYRALVLLTGFDDSRTPPRMLAALSDANDRLRELACEYFEHHVDPQRVPLLLKAMVQEGGEFVRPALLRALAAHGADTRVREALAAEVPRGETLFRSALIEALGDYRAEYAVPALVETVQFEGPLQVDAAIALGRIGDKRALNAVVAAQRGAPENLQPQMAAAICLLGTNCAAHLGYIDKTLRFAAANAGYQPLMRSAATAAAALSLAGNADALNLLFDVGGPAEDPARAPIALGVGTVALRNTPLVLSALEKRADRDRAVLLLRDAFDMLEEPYAKERFFVAVRRAYWQAPEGSEARKVAGLLIEKLEF